MSINKVGVPQPISVINKCCMCEKNADVMIDGELYCFEHAAEHKNQNSSDKTNE